jgi:hypothetical protein
MTFAAVTLLGITVGQPLGADYHAMNSRNIRIPIEYKQDRKSIRQVILYVARNGENTWYQEAAVTPDKDDFVYIAKDDGIYWFKMVIEDVRGNRDPVDLTRDPPDLKVLIDATAPIICVTNAKRQGDEITIEWAVEEKFPNDAETKVHFRATDNTRGYWQEVKLPENSRHGVRFRSGTNEPITVKISVADVAGNRTEVTREFLAAGATAAVTNPPPAPEKDPVTPISGTGGPARGATVPPPNWEPISPGPTAPVPPASVGPQSPPPPLPPTPPATLPSVAPSPQLSLSAQPSLAQPPQQPTPIMPTTSPAPVYNPPLSPQPQPLPTVDPHAPTHPTLPLHHSQSTETWSGVSPTIEVMRAQVINYPRFDIGFDLEQRGPSGISRVDLWVTRDDGKTWRKWSQHNGQGGVVRVVLDVRENLHQLEGSYGFRLVPVSGAGLSEREPVAGDAPELKVILDVTPPHIDLYPPEPDPHAPDTLVLKWKATDRNFGDDPITLEWSEAPTGPWKPVAMAASDTVIPASGSSSPTARRLPNTGQYAWRIPAGVPARVYLKATARDAAGNVKEIVTRNPILVDLTKPRAKINGIVAPAMSPP